MALVLMRGRCVASDSGDSVTISTSVYAHRAIPGVIVQDIKIYNSSDRPVQLSVEIRGISYWDTAVNTTKVIEHGEGGVKYSMVIGTVDVGQDRSAVVEEVSSVTGVNRPG